MQLAAHVITEAKYLSRVWMLNWVANGLAGAAPYLRDEPALLASLDELIEETGASLGRWSRAELALSRSDVGEALALTTLSGDRSDSLLQLRRDVTNMELRALVLTTGGQWQAAVELLEPEIARATEVRLVQPVWRMSALAAWACKELGQNEDAQHHLDAAEKYRAEIGAGIGNAAHRQSFLSGRVASRLGLAD